jgi:hypothetical protein
VLILVSAVYDKGFSTYGMMNEINKGEGELSFLIVEEKVPD